MLGWPLAATDLRNPTVTANLLADVDQERAAALHNVERIHETPAAHLHWYGKREARPPKDGTRHRALATTKPASRSYSRRHEASRKT